MERQFWYFLITGKQDNHTGVFANFYTYGKHCGDAFERTKIAAYKQNLLDCQAIEASRLDTLEKFQLPEDSIEIDAGIFMKPALHSFPLSESEHSFISPIGILKSTEDEEYDYELIKEAFVSYNKDENGIYEFEMVVDKSKLIETFIKTIDFLPSVDGFWIYIWNHWDDEKTELWASKDMSDKKNVTEFLLQQKSNTLENGYLDCVVHCKVGETNLILDDHKKIQLHTKDEDLFNDFGKKIMGLGFEQTTEFYSLEYGYHHYHYRPADSLSRAGFKELIRSKNFELINSWN